MDDKNGSSFRTPMKTNRRDTAACDGGQHIMYEKCMQCTKTCSNHRAAIEWVYRYRSTTAEGVIDCAMKNIYPLSSGDGGIRRVI